jgi:hypothetical protein
MVMTSYYSWVDGKKSATDQSGNKDTTSNNTAYYCIGPSDTTHIRVNAFYDGKCLQISVQVTHDDHAIFIRLF